MISPQQKYLNEDKDRQFGLNKEKTQMNIIIDTLGTYNLKKLEDRYAIFDYHDIEENVYVELKTRRNTMNAYPTTMIGYNKIIEGIKLIRSRKSHVYFFFDFTDCLTYFELTEDNYERIFFARGGRNDRGFIEQSAYAYIPINDLIKV